jgi:hypothetical protein
MIDFFPRENNRQKFGLDCCRIFQVRRGRAVPAKQSLRNLEMLRLHGGTPRQPAKRVISRAFSPLASSIRDHVGGPRAGNT